MMTPEYDADSTAPTSAATTYPHKLELARLSRGAVRRAKAMVGAIRNGRRPSRSETMPNRG